MKLKLKLNKKGSSLRSVTMTILFTVLTITMLFLWLGDGIEYYGKTVSSDYSTNFGKINESLTTMQSNSRNFNTEIDKIKQSPETSLFFIPDVILNAIKMSFEYVKIALNIITDYNTLLGIPLWIINAIITALLFYVGYLILDAYLRNKRT